MVELSKSSRSLIKPLEARLVGWRKRPAAACKTSVETLLAVSGDLARGLSSSAGLRRLE